MTNFEYYADEIKAIEYDFAYVDGKITKCSIDVCDEECEYFKDDCTSTKVKWLYSEHIEQPKLTKTEHEFLKVIPDYYYLARDKDDTLFLHSEKPIRCIQEEWYSPYEQIGICCDFFNFITWQDKEPWSVEDLLKLKVAE